MGAGRVPLWGVGALKCMFEGKSRQDDSRGRVVKQGCGEGGLPQTLNQYVSTCRCLSDLFPTQRHTATLMIIHNILS